MVWALAAILLLGVGVPISAWWLTRLRPAPSPDRLGIGYDQIDKWLLNQHRLSPLDRERVRRAVFRGGQLDDPTLARAAHDLATKLASGKLGRVWLARVVGGAHMMMGAAFIGWGVTTVITSHHVDKYIVLIPEGAWFVTFGALLAIWAPRRIQQQAATRLCGPDVDQAPS